MNRQPGIERERAAAHEGYRTSRRCDGSLRIDVNMRATPWPYNAWSWAAMLPGVHERLLAALRGRGAGLVVCMYRSRPRRCIDVVLVVQEELLVVHDVHAGVEHTMQIAAGAGADEPRLAQVVTSLVDAVLHAEGISLRAVSRCAAKPALGSPWAAARGFR